jgi:hypothetical protein
MGAGYASTVIGRYGILDESGRSWGCLKERKPSRFEGHPQARMR